MYPFLLILFIGLVIRFLLIGNLGFIADISFWKSWSLAAIDHGITWTSHNTNINYPPGFIYVLWLMGKIYSFFGNPHDFNNFWRQNNFAFLFASKSIAILADIAMASLIYWFFSQKEKIKKLGANLDALKNRNPWIYRHLPLILASVFYLNPIVIVDSALWGQVESFGIFFTVAAIVLLFYRKPTLATCVFTIGALMKLQNIIYIPIYFLFILRYFDFRTLARSIGASVLTFFVITLPFVVQNDMKQVLYLMTVNSDYFPWLSLNANNIWWIVARAKGMAVGDRITVLGVMNAKSVGLIIFSSFYALSSILVLVKPTPRNFLLSLTTAIFAFFLFTTQSHERYSYPVIILLLLLYPFLENGVKLMKKKTDQSAPSTNNGSRNGTALRFVPFSEIFFWLLYFFLTASIFFNMHMGLILNYPENGIGLLTKITTPSLTIANSYFLTSLFFLILPYVFTQLSFLYLLIPVAVVSAGLLKPHTSYLTSGKVSLTNYRPIITQQDFSQPQVNMSVNSSSGWKSWSRLSSSYFYFRKGFGSHANSFLVFDIDRKFSKFSTDYGIDTEAGTPASAVFKIYGDDKELFKSDKMGRFDFPKHAEVNVSGVKKLGLVINDGGDSINSDHADWFNPVLYR